jgi:hypothetical protein
MRSDDAEEVLVIHLEPNGDVSCFPTFKLSQEEFDTCDRYELTFESPEYDPYAKNIVSSCHDRFMGKAGGFRGLASQAAPSGHSPPEGYGNQEFNCDLQ